MRSSPVAVAMPRRSLPFVPLARDEAREAVELARQGGVVVGLEGAVRAGERLAAAVAQRGDVAAQRGPRREAVHARHDGPRAVGRRWRAGGRERGDRAGRPVLGRGAEALGAAGVVVEVGVVGELEAGPAGRDALDIGAQARPAREAVLAGDDELGGGELERLARRRRLRRVGGDALAGFGIAGAVGALEVAGAVAQLLQARRGGKRVGSSRQPSSLGARGPRASGGKKVPCGDVRHRGGLGPSRGRGAAPTARWPSLDDRLARAERFELGLEALESALLLGGAAPRAATPSGRGASPPPGPPAVASAACAARSASCSAIAAPRSKRVSASRLASSWPSRMRSSRGVARRARRAFAKRSHACANDDEARAPAAAVGGEHRAHAAGAVGVRADDDLARADPVEHRRAACGPAGSRSPGAGRRSVSGRVDIGLRASKATPPPRALDSVWRRGKDDLHEARRAHRLLGPRPHEPGPARDRPGGRAPRLRQRVDGRGLRLGRGDDPRLARRADVDDQDRLGDLPDARRARPR